MLQKSTKRLARLLRLVALLQIENNYTPTTLQELLGVSRRTLFRDLKVLGEAGYPTRYTRNNGYRIDGDPTSSTSVLTAKEILGMIMLSKVARAHSTQPMVGYGIQALDRMIYAAPKSVREACLDLMSHISVHAHTDCAIGLTQNNFMTLVRIIDQKTACIVNINGQNQTYVRSIGIVPNRLVLENKHWKVIGESMKDDQPLELMLSDITHIEHNL